MKYQCEHSDTGVCVKCFEKEKNKCPHCGMSKEIRNPSGYCDHLYYPDNCEVCSGKAPKEWPKMINGHLDFGDADLFNNGWNRAIEECLAVHQRVVADLKASVDVRLAKKIEEQQEALAHMEMDLFSAKRKAERYEKGMNKIRSLIVNPNSEWASIMLLGIIEQAIRGE